MDILHLRYSDIKKEFEAEYEFIAINHIRIKSGESFWMFIGPEALDALKSYLKIRKENGLMIRDKNCKPIGTKILNIKDDGYLFSAGVHLNQPWSYHSLKGMTQRAREEARIDFKLYDMRRYFARRLRGAEGVGELYVKFWLGHDLGVEKGYFSDDLEEHRKLYAEHYSVLSFGVGRVQKLETELKSVTSELATIRGFVDDLFKIPEGSALLRIIEDGKPAFRVIKIPGIKEMSDKALRDEETEIMGKLEEKARAHKRAPKR